MKRAAVWACMALGLVGCGTTRETAVDHQSVARVHNAVDFGLTTSTFFGVSRIDGTVVHRKFDRDRVVVLAPGEHRLGIRYYSEGLSRARHGVTECELTVTAPAGADYYLEGVVDGDRWRARAVDPRGGAVIDCVFGGGAAEGEIDGGPHRDAVSALPAAALPAGGEAHATTEPLAAPSPGALAVPSGEAAVAAAAVAMPPGRDPAVAAPTGDDVVASAPVAAPSRADAGALVEDPSDESVITTALRGRGHWGCAAGRYRVEAIAGEALALSGNERVRLLGIVPRSAEAYRRVLEETVGRCVSVEIDPELTEAGYHDRAGNLLAYVRDEAGVLLNAEAVRRGAADVDSTLRGRYLAHLLAAQNDAERGSP